MKRISISVGFSQTIVWNSTDPLRKINSNFPTDTPVAGKPGSTIKPMPLREEETRAMAARAAASGRSGNQKEKAMRTILMADPVRYQRMTSQDLRDAFLIDGLYLPGSIQMSYVDLDRA